MDGPVHSETVLEMAAERDPAKWAAMQIIKGGRPDMTCGEAADLIERIVRQAIAMNTTAQIETSGPCGASLISGIRGAALAAGPASPDGGCTATQRAYHVARRHGLTTALVADMADSELLSLRGIGPATLAVLRRFAPRIAT